MRHILTWALALVGLLPAAPAAAQGQLYGIRANGDLVAINRTTGAGTFIGSSGFGCNGASVDGQGRIITGDSALQLIEINPATGAGSVYATLSNAGVVGYGVRALAFDGAGVPWVAMSKASTTEIDIIATINLGSGTYTLVGPSGRTDLQGLAFDGAGNLYALGIQGGGALLSINQTTGAATLIGGGGMAGDTQAIEFDDQGVLYAARDNLLTLNPANGAATVVGPIGLADMRGLAFVPATCYPDCNGDGLLNIADFGCFQTKFATGNMYADCNGDSLLNIADFGCFQTKFAIGCP